MLRIIVACFSNDSRTSPARPGWFTCPSPARIRLDRHVAGGGEDHGAVGGVILERREAERVAQFVERGGADLYPRFERRLGLFGAGVLVEPGQLQVGRGELVGDNLVD